MSPKEATGEILFRANEWKPLKSMLERMNGGRDYLVEEKEKENIRRYNKQEETPPANCTNRRAYDEASISEEDLAKYSFSLFPVDWVGGLN